MRRLLWTQVRRHPGRYLATAVAVALGSGFVAVALLFTATLNRTLGDALTTELAGSSVVVGEPRVTAGANRIDPSLAERVAAVPGVAAVAGLATAPASAVLPRLGRIPVAVGLVADDPRLRWQHLIAGTYPDRPGEVLLDSQTATETGVGGALRVGAPPDPAAPSPAAQDPAAQNPAAQNPAAQDPAAGPPTVPVTVSGIADLGSSLTYSPPALFVRTADARLAGLLTGYYRIAVAGDGSVDDATLRDRVDATVQAEAGFSGLVTRTLAGQRAAAIRAVSFGTDILGGFLLGFAAISVVVAGLVIANTFAVLLAQRRRELALLRSVGADRRQVFASVIAEAAVLGTLAGVAGLAGALAVTAAAVRVLNRVRVPVEVSPVQVGVLAVLAPVAVGLVVTVLAAVGPARSAIRISPMAALRPVEPPAVGSAAGRLRATAGLALVAVGAVPLAVTVTRRGLAAGGGPGGVAVGIVGGLLTFLGVLVAGRLVVPAAVRVVGVATGVLGRAPGRLAVANALRNPVRTSATCSALVVGITLVTLVATGAATTRATFLAAIEAGDPVDVIATAPGLVLIPPQPGTAPAPTPAISRARLAALAAVPGLAASVPVTTANATLTAPEGTGPDGPRIGPVSAADLDAAARVMRGGLLAGAAPGQLLLAPDRVTRRLGVGDGAAVTLSGGRGSRALTVRVVPGLPVPALVSDTDLAAVSRTAPVPTAVWARTAALDRGGDPGQVAATVAAVQRAAGVPTGSGPGLTIGGGGLRAGRFLQILGVLLLVVTALVGVAVVIAVLGIGNTLSLSVAERRRESALLRALGLTRAGLRLSVALEAVTLAVVAAGVGIVLGIGYGFAGIRALLGDAVDIRFTVPVGQVAVLAGAAAVAGLLASVLPARRAARTPPAQALAEE